MKDTTQNFNFFIDDLRIEKAKDNKGNDVMKIGGVASTQDQDSDGEYLDPSGFDVSYFMDHGYINYNHQAKLDPEAVIGEPTSARVTSKGLEIEATLYPDNPLAQKVYSTTQMLEKSSKNRRMGFSIEGKAMERDLLNPKRIKKAMITGCAVTLNPKNPSTLVNIMKGDYGDELPQYDFDNSSSISKSQEDNLVELERDGKRIIIDKSMNIKIMDLESKKDDKTEKSLSTVSGAAISKEDVDRETKNIEGIDKPRKKVKYLSKSEAYNEIFGYIYKYSTHEDVVEKAKLMYELTESIVRSNNMGTNLENIKVTKEDISKAIELINAVPGSESKELETEEIEKSVVSKQAMAKSKVMKADEDEGTEDGPEKMDQKESYDDEEVEKALCDDKEYMKMKKACDDYKKSYKSRMYKGEIAGYPACKDANMESDENGASLGKEGEFIKKTMGSMGSGSGSLNKGLVDELVKGISSTIEAGQSKNNEILKSLGVIAQGTLEQTEKLTGENAELKKSLEDAMGRLQRVEETPIPSRTVQTQSFREKESFAKSHDAARGSNVLHGKSDRGQIMDIIESRCGFDGGEPNKKFMKSLQTFESENAIEKSVLGDLSREGINIEGVNIL